MQSFTNKTFERSRSERRSPSVASVDQRSGSLALVSGDVDVFHSPPMRKAAWRRRIRQGGGCRSVHLWPAGRQLPGPGTTIVAQDLRFDGSITVGDEVTATVTAKEKRPDGKLILFDCRVHLGGRDLISGTVLVQAPTQRITYSDVATPQLVLRHNDAFTRLLRAFRACRRSRPPWCTLRPRLAARSDRSRQARADHAGAGRSGSEDSRGGQD